MMFADAKDIKTDLVGQRDRLKQLPQMPCGLNGLAGFRIDGGGYEAV